MQAKRNILVQGKRKGCFQAERGPIAVARHHLVRDGIATGFNLDSRETHEPVEAFGFRITKPQVGFPKVGIEIGGIAVFTFAIAVTPPRFQAESVQKTETVTARDAPDIPFQILQGLQFNIFHKGFRSHVMVIVNPVTTCNFVMEKRFIILDSRKFLVERGGWPVRNHCSRRVSPFHIPRPLY